MTRILLDLALLVVIVVMLYGLRRTTSTVERPLPPTLAPPLDFSLVEQGYRDVSLLASREEVEKLLGPPTQRNVWGPEVRPWEEYLEHWNRHGGLPIDRTWDKWTDPEDEGKWVAVLYAGGKVRYKLKEGF